MKKILYVFLVSCIGFTTIISCGYKDEYDFSDLEEKIDYILTNFDKLNMEINTNIREQYATKYTYENLGEYWYNLFKNLDNVEEE